MVTGGRLGDLMNEPSEIVADRLQGRSVWVPVKTRVDFVAVVGVPRGEPESLLFSLGVVIRRVRRLITLDGPFVLSCPVVKIHVPRLSVS